MEKTMIKPSETKGLNELMTFEEDEKDKDNSKYEVLKILLNPKDINLKTELNDTEILQIAKLEVLSKRLQTSNLDLFLDKFKELRVSKARQGRKEIIGAMQDDETKKEGGFFNQFVTDLMGRNRQ